MISVLGAPTLSQALLKDLDRVGRKHGRWSPAAYFELQGSYQVEYQRGRLDILPMPNVRHQLIARRFFSALNDFVEQHGIGIALFAGTRLRVADDTFREPDVMVVSHDQINHAAKEFFDGSQLVAEVVSESNREHDVETKRAEYAAARVPEYWIIDPAVSRVTVLRLEASEYVLHGVFNVGQPATSATYNGFVVDTVALFASP